MNLLWAPGQSDAARELCRHLNGREKAALYGLGALLGLCFFAIPLVIMDLATGIGLLQGRLEGFGFPLVVCFVAAVWLNITLQRRLLLGSRFAKDQGLTWADIGARQALSRRDHLILGGFAALAAAIALAGTLAVFLIAAQ